MAANPSIQLGTDGNWAIKEDNLLAYKKDGTRFFNKEFDFTRGSLATFVDKDGLIKYSGVTGTELVVNGDFATDSDWTLGTGITISNGKANFTGNANTFLTQSGVVSSGKTYKATFTVSNYVSGAIDINLGGSTRRGNISANGTYIFYITVPSGNILYFQEDFSNGFVGSIDNVSVKEIQLDVPRIDFTDDTTGHLLLEPQSTNLVPYSENFSYSSWLNIGSPTITSNYSISPDGNLNSTRVQFASSSNSLYDPIPHSIGNTASIYVKGTSGETIQFGAGVNVGVGQLFTLNGKWQRIEFQSTGTTVFCIGTYQSATARDIEIWGAQLEEQSYVTSYIPTNGSSVTRNAEVCDNSGSAQDFNDSEGVLYAEISSIGNDGVGKYYSISDGTSSNRIRIGYSFTDNTIRALVISQGSSAVDYTHTVSDVKSFSKVGFSYKQNEFSFWIDGVKAYTDTSGNTPTGLNSLQFENGNGGGNFYGKTKNLKVFKRAMSDGELYLLTVPQYQSYQEMATALNYTL